MSARNEPNELQVLQVGLEKERLARLADRKIAIAGATLVAIAVGYTNLVRIPNEVADSANGVIAQELVELRAAAERHAQAAEVSARLAADLTAELIGMQKGEPIRYGDSISLLSMSQENHFMRSQNSDIVASHPINDGRFSREATFSIVAPRHVPEPESPIASAP